MTHTQNYLIITMRVALHIINIQFKSKNHVNNNVIKYLNTVKDNVCFYDNNKK